MIFITLPALAKQSQPLNITEIAQGIYLQTSFQDIACYGLVDSNGLIVVDGRQTYIIDPLGLKKTLKHFFLGFKVRDM